MATRSARLPDPAALKHPGLIVSAERDYLELRENDTAPLHLLEVVAESDGQLHIEALVRSAGRDSMALFARNPDGSVLAAARARLRGGARVEWTPNARAGLSRQGTGWWRVWMSVDDLAPRSVRAGLALLGPDLDSLEYPGEADHGVDLKAFVVNHGPPGALAEEQPMTWAQVMASEEIFGPEYRHFTITLRGFARGGHTQEMLSLRLAQSFSGFILEIRPADSRPPLFSSWPADAPQDDWGYYFRAMLENDAAAHTAGFAARLSPADRALFLALLEGMPRIAEAGLAVARVAVPDDWRAAALAIAALVPAGDGAGDAS